MLPGTSGRIFFGGPETPEHFTKFYCGIMVPWFQVHARDVESYRAEGDRVKGGKLTAPLTAGWAPGDIAALTLYDGKIWIDAGPGRPVMVFPTVPRRKKRKR